MKLLQKDIHGIGKLICTKAPGSFNREDITSSYKFPEKSDTERSTMLKALKQSEHLYSRYYLNEDFNDVHFELVLLDDIKIGQPFDAKLQIKNKSKEKSFSISVVLMVNVVTYTGRVGKEVKKGEFSVTLAPNSMEDVKLTVSYEEYGKRLIDQGAFNISCLAAIEDTKFEYYAEDDFRVRKPDIVIKLQEKAIENKEVKADIYVENPLPVVLRKGEFTIDAPGIERSLKVKVKSNVPVGGIASGQFSFVPPKTGRATIAAKFTCKEMDDVDGFLFLLVEPEKSENGTPSETTTITVERTD